MNFNEEADVWYSIKEQIYVQIKKRLELSITIHRDWAGDLKRPGLGRDRYRNPSLGINLLKTVLNSARHRYSRARLKCSEKWCRIGTIIWMPFDHRRWLNGRYRSARNAGAKEKNKHLKFNFAACSNKRITGILWADESVLSTNCPALALAWECLSRDLKLVVDTDTIH